VVPETLNHFIGGQYARSTYGKTFGVADPATGKEYARVAVGLAADVNNAVRAADFASETGSWPGLPAPDRAGVLNAIADGIDARAGEITAAEVLGGGLPVAQAREVADRAAGEFRRVAGLVPARPAARVPDTGCYVSESPAGVAGVCTGWQMPFLAQARAVAPALAAGCTVVLSPDLWTPLPAALLAEIGAGAGLPDGVLNVVYGTGDWRGNGDGARTDVPDALAAHPRVARFAPAAQTAGSPCLIFADADLDQAADSALFGALALNGQRRTATTAVLAERPVYDAVVSRLAARARRIRVGAPADPSTELGPLVHAEHCERVSSYVRLAVREGARMAAGGRRPAGLAEGNYLEATVLQDVTPQMRIFAEEVCGPVLRVTPFGTDAEAVSLASAAPRGPAAYLWTSDPERAHRLAAALDAAAIWVNGHNAADLPDPPDDLAFYTRSRTVHLGAGDAAVPRLGA
jgi:5-carboxymethyl-2-hydroxymuconic-semialdehyde dehydrogenase